MRLHLVALPHTEVSKAFEGCAYTGKVRKFCKMMKAHYEILLYAPEGPKVEGATLIPCLTKAERIKTFGKDDPARLPDWPTDAQTAMFNLNVITALQGKVEKGDLVLITAGRTHLPITQTLPDNLYAEWTVGYDGVIGGPIFAAFESYSWLAHVYAKTSVNDIRYFDRVIPPYYDAADFPKLNKGDGQYLAFLGRRIERKGLKTAAIIAKAVGMPLLVAGAGTMTVNEDGADVTYLGPLNVAARARFLAKAKALLVPTTYLEPGGNVAIEAMACGTPVIATDQGVFTETVPNGVGGFRFRMLREAVCAVNLVDGLDPKIIRGWARSQYSLEATAPKFKAWFEALGTLRGAGWYTLDC
jgi:glycosyltransferase involved in cell wall biosynthesis